VCDDCEHASDCHTREEEEPTHPFWSVNPRGVQDERPEHVRIETDNCDRNPEWETVQLDWWNSASIDIDESEDTISFHLSTGDPRGADISFHVRRDMKTGLKKLSLRCREEGVIIDVDATSPKYIVANDETVEARRPRNTNPPRGEAYDNSNEDHQEFQDCHCGNVAYYDVSERTQICIADQRIGDIVETGDMRWGEGTMAYICEECMEYDCRWERDNWRTIADCPFLRNQDQFQNDVAKNKKMATKELAKIISQDVAKMVVDYADFDNSKEIFYSHRFFGTEEKEYDLVGIYQRSDGRFDYLVEFSNGERKRIDCRTTGYDKAKEWVEELKLLHKKV
jgi:hypothetical protein